MGDGHYSVDPANVSQPTQKKNTGANQLYGLGRVKLRRQTTALLPYGQTMTTRTFSSGSADYVYAPFSSPLPADTDFVKCTMLQVEDTSETGSHVYSDIDLVVHPRAAVGGTCSTMGASALSAVTDSSKDAKAKVSIKNINLPGKCIWVTLDKISVPTAGISTHTFCYYSGADDDEPD